jgi:acetyltransferase-like isoleucine patch superfamily enzyme
LLQGAFPGARVSESSKSCNNTEQHKQKNSNKSIKMKNAKLKIKRNSTTKNNNMVKQKTIFNEKNIHIGSSTMIGSHIALSAGMMPGQKCLTNPVVRIGDRCLIGRGSGIVGHFSIDIGNDVWTGHYVYITDQNHGYENVDIPISQQTQMERAVSIGDGSWLGAGTVVLPGAQIGKHVAVGANSVVTGALPDYCVAVGVPARVIKQYSKESGWVASNYFNEDGSN